MAVQQLSAENQAKYSAAVGLGTRQLLLHVENVVHALTENPSAVPNLRLDAKKKDGGTHDPANPQNHSRWRYSAYRDLAIKLELQGKSSIPLPLVCETLIKVCWPGPPRTSYTGFVATAGVKRGAAEEECEVHRDADGKVILGTHLSPLKKNK